ncbi:germin-like protein subfamily T member 2 [Papaver somniferum]|uniref:germin-like protein subfamily T member 2 n=1 Tax=Papaver somniferum TaxID=3469 RepID=UPI000E6FEFC7|nr:germin-like protein subfamily T member 2 [Papaver somniferum]
MAADKFSIKTTTPFFLVLCLTVFLFFTLSCFADPDEQQDFCVADFNATTILNGFPCKPVSEVTSNDFFYSGLVKEASTANPFGLGVRLGDVNNFPGLNTLGLSINRADFAPSGVIPLHTHPRAREVVFIIKGEVLVGFISTTNVLYSKVLKAGEIFIVPKGLVHFLNNVGRGKASGLAIFNSQLPGTAILANNLFGSKPTIPSDILAKNFQVEENVITSIKSRLFCLAIPMCMCFSFTEKIVEIRSYK